MKILILEYFISRGGLLNQKISFYSEGIKMLNSLLHSFADIDDIEITTYVNSDFYHFFSDKFLDKKIIFKETEIKKGEVYFSYLDKKISDEYDYFLLVAPETDNILFDLSKLLEKKGIKNLSSNSAAIAEAGNKWTVYKSLKNSDINQPHTIFINNLKHDNNFKKEIAAITFPALLKAVYSAGSELEVINNKEELHNFDYRQDYLLQKLLKGISGSISVLANDNDFRILSINKQIIDQKNYKYLGGIIDYPFPEQDKLTKMTENVKSHFPDLKGYFGIDFIYSNGDFFLLEINPRITSSVIGLIKKLPLAKYIITSNVDNSLPEDIITDEQRKFSIY